MKEIKLNGVSFNLQAVANYKDAEDFYSSPSHQHYWGNIAEAERHKRLTFVYEQANIYKADNVEVEFKNMNFTDSPNKIGFESIPAAQADKIISNNVINIDSGMRAHFNTEQVDRLNKLLINEINSQSNDSGTTDNKPKKSKRPRRNSKDAD